MPFQFENLEIYQSSLDWVQSVGILCQSLKGKIPYTFTDQLSRAALSIPLNIAEGNGRWHKPEKKQFFRIARGSIFECIPIIQILYRMNHLNEIEYNRFYSHLQIMSKMITNLIKSVDNLGCGK